MLKKDEDKVKDISGDLVHWHCEKCSIRIGVIDLAEKQIRIRYKDLVIYYEWKTKESIEDRIVILCRRCAWNNVKTKKELVDLETNKIK